MPIPLIAAATGAMLRKYGLKAAERYGLKKLSGKAKQEAMKKAKRSATAKVKKDIRGRMMGDKERNAYAKAAVADKKETAAAFKKQRAVDVAKNIATDASGAGVLAGSLYDAVKIGEYENKADLRKQVKSQYPKLWKAFASSEYDDIEKFLKAKGVL